MQRRTFLSAAVAFNFCRSLRPVLAQTATVDFSAPLPGETFSWAGSRYAWEFSQLAYLSADDLGKMAPAGLDLSRIASLQPTSRLTLHDTQALAWQRNDCSLIAFRGTEGGKAMDAILPHDRPRNRNSFGIPRGG